ncbi:MAG: glycosyltransferase [Acidiferrobacteraceae bacterium]
MLFSSRLAQEFDLLYFQVGSEGRQRDSLLHVVFRLASSPLALAWFLFRYKPDLVHLNTSLDQKAYWRDSAYFVVARLMGCRVINQVHGGALPQIFFSRSRFLTWILRRVLLASQVVVVLSNEEAESYRLFDSRINVELVPNAIAGPGTRHATRSLHRATPLRLAYVGRLVATKGLFDTVAALSLLKAGGRVFTFRIAGGGPDDQHLRAAVTKVGLEHEITFLGPLFGEAKDRLWLESDIFVFPTYHREGLPYALLEAMAAGCVPVTCAVAAIPDVMQDKIHGLFVPPRDAVALADALAELDDERDTMARMSVASRTRIEEYYTLERLEGDFRRLYMRACSG